MAAMSREEGQATVELVAALPALMLAGLIALQLLVAGYASTLADGAAEAGALALATGRRPGDAARGALPGWARDRRRRGRLRRHGHGAIAAADPDRDPLRPARHQLHRDRAAGTMSGGTILATAVGEASGARGQPPRP